MSADDASVPTARARAILLLGPTGSGKSPLGNQLQRQGFGGARCLHFDFGAQLREIVRGDRSAGQFTPEDIDLLRGVLDTGTLLEDEHVGIAERILRWFMARRKTDPQTWIVLNGLPRHLSQARALEAILDVRVVVELRCSPDTVLERIRANADGDRSGREDDDPQSVRRKLALYEARTLPLVDYYRTRGARFARVDVLAQTMPQDVLAILERLC